MPTVGPRCHELRIVDAGVTWRLMYRTDEDAIVIVEVFKKKTRKDSHDGHRRLPNTAEGV